MKCHGKHLGDLATTQRIWHAAPAGGRCGTRIIRSALWNSPACGHQHDSTDSHPTSQIISHPSQPCFIFKLYFLFSAIALPHNICLFQVIHWSINWPPNYTGQDNNVLFSCMLLTWFLCKKQRLLFFLLFQPIVPKTTNAGDIPCDSLTRTRGELTILGQPKPDEDSFNLFVMDSSWLQDNSHGSHRGTLLESAVHYTQEGPRRPRFTGSGSVE